MTRRFPETFLTLLGCLLLLAALASAVGAVPLQAASHTGCSGRLCQQDGEWVVETCTGACSETTPCKVYIGQNTGHTYCGCSPLFEPACCYVYVDKNGDEMVGGDCPNCPAPGDCVFQPLPNGCLIARCND